MRSEEGSGGVRRDVPTRKVVACYVSFFAPPTFVFFAQAQASPEARVHSNGSGRFFLAHPLTLQLFISSISLTAVWQLSRGCRWLQEILLAWCVQLTDTSFVQIAANCPLLTHLSLRGCNKVSDSAVVQLAQNCCYLRDLDLRGCDKVSQGGMDALAVMIPSCIVHFLDKSYNKKPGLGVTR